jgi:sec-independent protein translocase protein TatC
MALREHLAELRRRVVISAIAVVLGAIAGWFLANPVMENFIIEPVLRATRHGQPVTIAYTTIASAFNIKVKVAAYIGIVIASPIWLYQIWAFITPGLTRKERRYSLIFVAFATPLFLAGVTLAVLVLPKAITIGNDFALKNTISIPDAATVITFATRLIIALGVAFLTPLFLVGLNLMGFLSGKALGGQWRVAVFISFLFAAIVSPSPDATQMIILALPLVLLYTISVGIALFNDRRRRLARERDPVFGVGDDEASELDLTPGDPIEAPGPVSASESLDR